MIGEIRIKRVDCETAFIDEVVIINSIRGIDREIENERYPSRWKKLAKIKKDLLTILKMKREAVAEQSKIDSVVKQEAA